MVSAALRMPSSCPVKRVHVVEGQIGGKVIKVPRNTGCNLEGVSYGLAPEECHTGTSAPFFVLQSTVIYLPEAMINVSSSELL